MHRAAPSSAGPARRAALLVAAAVAAVAAALAAGCARDVRARYPSTPQDPTGTLVLRLSKPASGVSVAINGVLVVEDAHTERVTIADVPTGNNEIVITANGGDKAMRAWVASERPTTIPLGVPDASVAMWKSLFGSLVTIAAYSLLH